MSSPTINLADTTPPLMVEKKIKTFRMMYIPEAQYDKILEAYEKDHYCFCRKINTTNNCLPLQFEKMDSGDTKIYINKGGDISENIILKKVTPSLEFFFCP